MRSWRVECLFLALVVGAVVSASCGLSTSGLHEAAQGGAGAGGTPIPCDSAADCPGDDDPACGQRRCEGGFCAGDFAPSGADCGGGKICDGLGLCVSCLSSQNCAPGTCVDGTQSGGEICVSGECEPVMGSLSCAPYQCNEAMTNCRTGCDTAADCIALHYCASGNCLEQKPLGQACVEHEECRSGFCVDAVCCDTACDSACEACVAAAAPTEDGTCAPIEALTDPHDECLDVLGCSGVPACGVCGTTPAPLFSAPNDPCPAECDSCNGGTCVIDCTGTECKPQVACPYGWDCQIHCSGNNSCDGSEIFCPDGYACNLDCGNSGNHCKDALVHCGEAGICNVTCEGGNACKNMTVECGGNDCTVTCTAAGDAFNVTGCPNTCTSCLITQCP